MQALARSLPELDVYATYLYLLLCDHFANSCIIAEREGRLIGFVTGYRKPKEPETLFIWQVATAPSARGRGLGSALLDALMARPENADVRYLETTVGSENFASRKLFAALAQRRNAQLHELRGYPAELFASPHHAEPLLRIGAFQGESL